MSDTNSEAEGFNLDDAIRKVPGFPKPGILFYDITSILTNPDAFAYCIDSMMKLYRNAGIDAVAAIESRGFVIAAPFCVRMGLPLLLVRKKGKLPGPTVSQSYDLEKVRKGSRFLIVDDLTATGGTINATSAMIRRCGAEPVRAFSVIGLPFLNYMETVRDLPIDTLIEYFGE